MHRGDVPRGRHVPGRPLWHPSGRGNNHPVIFTKYAKSDPWVAVHFLQLAGV